MISLWKNWQRAAAIAVVATFTAPGLQAAGLMTPANSGLPELQIKQHHVNVVIEDGYAITSIDQTFFNPHAEALEAVYSFPVPAGAAVGEFTYWIDGRPVTGEVLEKQQAREVYAQEKAQGRETALTEQDDYRTFDSHVYPVQPQSDVRIRLVYLQALEVDLGIGRYVYPLEEGGVDEEKLAFWNYNDVVEEDFSFTLKMRSSYPVDTFRLPQHPGATIQRASDQVWEVALGNTPRGNVGSEEDDASAAAHEAPEAAGPGQPAFRLDRDIVVYWRHRQGLPGGVDMITHKPPGSERGTFMMTVTPGDDLGAIEKGRDWVFVLDVSGSMTAKYQSLLEGVRRGLGKLNPEDRFRVVLFNNGAREVTRGYLPVNEANVQRVIGELEAQSPSGGTNLYAGLETGYQRLEADRPSAVILVTDGVANVGVTQKKEFLELLEKHDVRLFSFVMGNSANRPLLEGMTKASNGFSMNISNGDDISGRLIQTAEKLSHEAYRDIEVKIDGVKVKDLTPARIGSLYRGQQLVLFGHYWGDGEADVRISGKVSERDVNYRTRFAFPAESVRNPEVERLWAFATIDDLQDRIDYLGEDADSRQGVVDLALEYGLVTNYTSMLVVREAVFEELGIERDNATRLDAERVARARRAAGPVRDNRRDTAQPAFSGPRATPGSGGGALGPWSVLLFLPLLFAGRRRSGQ